MRPSRLALLAVVVLAGCTRGDYITLRGNLVAPPPGTGACTLSLPQLRNAPNATDYVRHVQGHFQETFPIARATDDKPVLDYEVEIACDGHIPMRRTAHFPEGTFAVDLGVVVLAKEPAPAAGH